MPVSQATFLLSKTGHWLQDVVFPRRCAGCRTWSTPLFCEVCRDALQLIVPPCCHVCGIPHDPVAHSAAVCSDCQANRYHPAPAFDLVRSVFKFEEPMRSAVHRFKYQRMTGQAAGLGQIMHEFLLGQPPALPALPYDSVTHVVPVPLHAWRRYRRGYNQSELLAREIARRLGLPMADMLRRERHTAAQVALSRADRAANVKGAFVVHEKLARPGPVLLIDDVCTTGATLAECAKVLKKAGVPAVYGLTLARQL